MENSYLCRILFLDNYDVKMRNLYLCPSIFLDNYLEKLGFKRLSKKYAGKGITLKKTLSDKRYRRIFASPDFEANLDNIINSDWFTDEVIDIVDIVVNEDGTVETTLSL